MALKVQGSAAITYTYARGDLFDTVTVNNIKFALFHKPLTSTEGCRDITITAKDCNCVFLAPIEAEGDIIIQAVNVLALDSFSPRAGKTCIDAENFYGLGTRIQGDAFLVQTSNNALTLGLHGSVDTLEIKSKNYALVHAGMDERIRDILTDIKALCAQGFQDASGLQIAQALLKAAVALNDQHQVVIPALTFHTPEALPEPRS